MYSKKETIKVKLKDLKPHPKNPKLHNDELIEKSIGDLGYAENIVIDENNVILAGHGRVKALLKKGEQEQEAIRITGWTEEEKEKYLLLANQSTILGGFDDIKLKDFTGDILDYAGLDADMLIEPDEKDDVIPEVPEEPQSKLGDLYILGNHRVLCGDSTKIEDVERLMDGKLSDMIHTDPPYNVDYGSSKNPRHKIRSIENDSLSSSEWEDFCKKLFANFKLFNKGDIYMWGASGPEGMKMRLWLTETGCHWSATIIWKKDRLVLTPANYQRMYEPCFYGWYSKSTYDGGRKETEVWEMKRPSDSKLHPTMKPIEVCVRAITNSSKERDIVLDLFLGSGSTLIASEKTGRICYGMEIDPKYCDVIIKRWELFTGLKAVKLN